jgi:energy-coupling factor transporter ATP-binding protein EcfA2
MFRFLEISLHGWAMWSTVRIPLDRNVILVSGPNGSGKTTLLDALRQLLNAPRLSSRRRLQLYLRRPDAPALIRAVVSNTAPEGGFPPFRAENILDREVTLACALVPSGGGVPEKRFAILGGRVPAPDLQKVLLESKRWYLPDRYSRALEKAGVTRSLMTILAIEQGKLNSISDQKPRELFSHVLEMLGDKAVLDRYRDARRRYEDTRLEVSHQMEGLQTLQVQLAQVARRVSERDAWEGARAKVDELESRLPAAELQKMLRARDEVGSKLGELRTKVRNGDAEGVRLGEALAAAIREEERRKDVLLRQEEARDSAESDWERAQEKASATASEVKRLEGMEREAAALPAADLDALRSALESARLLEFTNRQSWKELEARRDGIRLRLSKLESGLPAYPEAVTRTLEGVVAKGIPARLLADLVVSVDETVASSVEAALGDARYALLIPTDGLQIALQIAREHGFPGPVYSSEVTVDAKQAGPLSLSPGAPLWIEPWMEGVRLDRDGSWADARGRWIAAVQERVLGKTALSAEIDAARRLLEDTESTLAKNQAAFEKAQQERQVAESAFARESRRSELLNALASLPGLRKQTAALAEDVIQARAAMELARRACDSSLAALHLSAQERRKVEEDLKALVARLEGERSALKKDEADVLVYDACIKGLEPRVSGPLRERALRGELDSPDTVKEDLARARGQLTSLGEPPPPEVREEHRQLEANVREAEAHVTERKREADEAGAELSECRKRYLEVVDSALQDYRKRAVELGKRADVAVEIELPRLENDDRALDEAGIQASFGFDGKDPLPLGDSSFSGGQQVISGILLIMAMAETDGQGFFLLDEPFAHLSLDRVDDVGKFLRSARAQFLLTAPTTLDRAQLDPASMVIVLQKKKPGDGFAPDPIVALS